MKNFLKRNTGLAANVDRIESRYGNVMVRGWALDRKSDAATILKVQDAGGKEIPVYVERLVRSDVNELFGKPEDYAGGFHILIDRAVLDAATVWIVVRAEKNVDGNLKRNPGESISQEVSEKDIKGEIAGNGRKNSREELKIRVQIRASSWLERRIRLHKEKKEGLEPDYDLWIRSRMVHGKEAHAQQKAAENFADRPLFSVVIPLYNTPKPFLKEIVDSVLQQTYPDVELCLADGSSDPSVREFLKKHYAADKRLRYRKLKENRGISENTNEALRMAKGDFIVFADHDDVLERSAFFEMAKAVNQDPKIDVIYTDEDKVNRSGTAYFGPHFKPDYNRELLCCNNYICHLFALRRDLLKKVGLLNREYDGAQDYDLFLRCVECAEANGHVPRVLYHWRCHTESTSENPFSKQYAVDAGRRALEDHLKRQGIAGEVTATKDMGFYTVRYPYSGNPLVSIVIPSRDEVETLKKCLAAIQKTHYANYEVIVVENNSAPETFDFYRSITSEEVKEGEAVCYEGTLSGGQRICVAVWKEGFNYSALNNFGVSHAKGEYLVLMNNDIEMITEDWLEEMLGTCQRREVGVVGAKLYYPDDTVQHAGIVVGIGGNARGIGQNMFMGLQRARSGYLHKASLAMDYSAVTAACLMVKRSIYEAVGGFEEKLAVAFNDVDFCLKVRKEGYLVVYQPRVEAYHYESKSRGSEDSPEKVARFGREIEYMRNHWIGILKNGDPYYNPNFSTVYPNYALRDYH